MMAGALARATRSGTRESSAVLSGIHPVQKTREDSTLRRDSQSNDAPVLLKTHVFSYAWTASVSLAE